MKIIGAGMAGLLAANMLRRHNPVVLEAQEQLPDNHGALLRFRSNVVAEATGQHFREVSVLKGLRRQPGPLFREADLASANRYSIKVTGKAMPRSILNLDPAQRWIAPDDFLEVLGKGLSVRFNYAVGFPDIREMGEQGFPIISTIPMGALMSMVPDWEGRVFEFPSVPIWSLRTKILDPPIDVHQTVYYPGPELHYRASITGNLLTVEYLKDPLPPIEHRGPQSLFAIRRILDDDFGIDIEGDDHLSSPSVHYQHFGKILPIDDQIRKEFILEMTDRYRIYSLGRFATWRQILLDDVVKDIRQIDRWITDRDNYERRRIGS